MRSTSFEIVAFSSFPHHPMNNTTQTQMVHELDSYCRKKLHGYGIIKCDCNNNWSCYMHREQYPASPTCDECGQYLCSCPGEGYWRLNESTDMWMAPDLDSPEYIQLNARRRKYNFWYNPQAYWKEHEQRKQKEKVRIEQTSLTSKRN